MANRQQNQEYKIKKELNKDLGYDYIEIEFILQGEEGSQESNQQYQEQHKGYALGAKLSRKERRKDRRKRQKSWIEINHRIDEYSIAESRISY